MREMPGPGSGTAGAALTAGAQQIRAAMATLAQAIERIGTPRLFGTRRAARRSRQRPTPVSIPGLGRDGAGYPSAPPARRLFPEGHDDLVVAVEDQVEPVGVVHDAGDAVGRRDGAEAARQFLGGDDPCAGRTLFDELLADQVLAVVRLDLGLGLAGDLLELDRVGAGADAIELKQIPGKAEAKIKANDGKDLIGKKFVEKGPAGAGVVTAEELPRGFRTITPTHGVAGIVHNPNRLNLILDGDNKIVMAFWE